LPPFTARFRGIPVCAAPDTPKPKEASWRVRGVLAASFALALCCTASPAQTVTGAPQHLLYATFQDHAVLQRNKPIPVWGTAKPGADVEVSLSGLAVKAKADETGNWRALLPAMPAGGPYELSAVSSGGERQTVRDVQLGDVYLCSGQSNMEMPVRFVSNYDREIRTATNTNIRLFHVARVSSPAPQTGFGAPTQWRVTSPDAVKDFSAVCYFFARDLQPAAGVPVGVIEAAWGGSVIQAWMSREKLAAIGGYEGPLETLQLYQHSPEAAWERWRGLAHDWWTSHDPALGASPSWADPAYDDRDWPQAVATGNWRSWNIEALKTFEGLVWLRKSFTLTAAQAKTPATLHLGPIDRADTTWVNGVDVGEFEGPETARVYKVPAGALREGENVLAIGILAGGGLLKPGSQLTLQFADGSAIAFDGPWRYKLSKPFRESGSPPHVPWLYQQGVSLLYNGMIAPLGQTPVRGVVWYQGESDAWQANEYARLLPAMLDDWRSRFGSETPFFIVQLPGFGPAATRPQASDWARLREVQRRVAAASPNLALAVTIDLGARDFMHPTSKPQVGHRLALLAERRLYDKPVVDSGPTPLGAARTGNAIVVSFDNIARGLVTYEWGGAIGFQLCDAKNACFYAEGTVGNGGVRLAAAKLSGVTHVRYCWSDCPICNLYNTDDLPAVPFDIPVTKGKSADARAGGIAGR
jgi:sialate O-acetylesterase